MGEDILAKATECQDAWNRYTMLNRTVEAGKRFNAAKNILRVEAAALVGGALMLAQLRAWEKHRPVGG